MDELGDQYVRIFGHLADDAAAQGWLERPADKDGTGLPEPDRPSLRASDIANVVLFLATTFFATGSTSSMLRTPACFGKCHLPPITAYPWISILASGTASAVMVIRALPGKLSPNTSRRICVRRSP
jgi:hypothetical protein